MWSRVSLAWSRLLLVWARRRWPRMPAWWHVARPGLPAWRRSTVLNVAGSVLAVLVALGAVLFALLAGKGHPSHVAASRPVPPSGQTSSYVPPAVGPTLTDVGASGSSAATFSEQDARRAVIAYLNAVNARNKVQAGALICQSLLPTWLQNVDASNSDFNYTVTSATFAGSSGLGGSTLSVHYTLVFNDKTTNDVDFTVIDENGPKICGEQRA